MRPDRNARHLLGVTRAKAKMWEYHVPEGDHIRIDEDPAKLFDVAVGSLCDIAAIINGEVSVEDEQSKDVRAALKFASQFFDSYGASHLNDILDSYTALCASACFYLCDMPGSSELLAAQKEIDSLNLNAGGLKHLERLLLWVLRNDASFPLEKQRAETQMAGISIVGHRAETKEGQGIQTSV